MERIKNNKLNLIYFSVGKSGRFASTNLDDGDKETYWATDDGVLPGSLEFDFGKPQIVR